MNFFKNLTINIFKKLTGTPIQDKLDDLYSLLKVTRVGVFSDFKFWYKYFKIIKKYYIIVDFKIFIIKFKLNKRNANIKANNSRRGYYWRH